MTIEQLENQLRQGNLENIYLLYGEEVFLLENILKKIKKQFGELISGINYVLIGEENINSLLSEIETPAFGYEKKLIIARDTGLFRKDGKRKNAKLSDLQEKISKYIEENISNIKESIVLVFIEENIEKESFYKTIEKYATICNFEKQKPVQIIKRLKEICLAYKVKVNDETLKYLLECSGTNMQDLINEIRKLIEYTRTKTVKLLKRKLKCFLQSK